MAQGADFDRIQAWALANLPTLVAKYGRVTLHRGGVHTLSSWSFRV